MYGDEKMPGLTPRAIENIWVSIDSQSKRGWDFSVSVYMAELYLVRNPSCAYSYIFITVTGASSSGQMEGLTC